MALTCALFFGARRIEKGEFNVSTLFGVFFQLFYALLGMLSKEVCFGLSWQASCTRLFHHAQICEGYGERCT